MTGFPVCRPAELEDQPPDRHWLVEPLWGRNAVGIVGGEPKCGKSFLALDMAVAVAAGTPCLRHFPVCQTGPVLLFAAEDAPPIVRTRIAGICKAARTPFETLDMAVITAPGLRLDHATDRERLTDTVARIRPRLLVLDPLVRLHSVDENAVAEMAPILAFLRQLQRTHGAAILLVHHARKTAASRPGQALRGSSELHAWGDSNLYLRRRKDRILLSAEHRNAPGLDEIELQLADTGAGPAMQMMEPAPDHPEPETAARRILAVIAQATRPSSPTPCTASSARDASRPSQEADTDWPQQHRRKDDGNGPNISRQPLNRRYPLPLPHKPRTARVTVTGNTASACLPPEPQLQRDNQDETQRQSG